MPCLTRAAVFLVTFSCGFLPLKPLLLFPNTVYESELSLASLIAIACYA
jgi:hypothetical protein